MNNCDIYNNSLECNKNNNCCWNVNSCSICQNEEINMFIIVLLIFIISFCVLHCISNCYKYKYKKKEPLIRLNESILLRYKSNTYLFKIIGEDNLNIFYSVKIYIMYKKK